MPIPLPPELQVRLPLPLVAAVLLGCGSEPPAPHSMESLPGGIVKVVNHAPSEWSDTLGWKIVLEAEHILPADGVGTLDRPNYPHRLANGEIVVLDQIEPFIQRYDAEMRPIARFGRAGSGPGEFQNGGFRTAGDSIVVLEESRSTLALFSGDGTFLYEERIPTFTDWIGPRDARGRIPLLGRYAPKSDAGVMWWALDERRVVDSIIGPAGPDMRVWSSCAFVFPYQPTLSLTPTLDGNAWWGVSDADRFVLTRTGYDTLRIVETPNRPRFPVDSARVNELFDPKGFLAQQCGADMRRSDIPTMRPAWSSLNTDAQNNLWVARPSGYDVYDPEGRWLGVVPLAFGRGEFPYWNGDEMLSADVNDDGAMVVRRYRIVR